MDHVLFEGRVVDDDPIVHEIITRGERNVCDRLFVASVGVNFDSQGSPLRECRLITLAQETTAFKCG